MQTIKSRIAAARDRGATPLEILAGLVLLGIIFGFLIVKFFGWRENTQDKGVQTTLRNALLAAESVYQQEADYIGSATTGTAAARAAAAMQRINPEIVFTDAAYTATVAKNPNRVYVQVAPGGAVYRGSAGTVDLGQGIFLAARGESGNHFCIAAIADSTNLGDIGTYYSGQPESANAACNIANATTTGGTPGRTNGFPGV